MPREPAYTISLIVRVLGRILAQNAPEAAALASAENASSGSEAAATPDVAAEPTAKDLDMAARDAP